MSLYEAETSWAEVPKGRSDLGPKWKKAEVTGYPAEYYGFDIFHIMIYIYFIAALSHRQRLNSYYRFVYIYENVGPFIIINKNDILAIPTTPGH